MRGERGDGEWGEGDGGGDVIAICGWCRLSVNYTAPRVAWRLLELSVEIGVLGNDSAQ